MKRRLGSFVWTGIFAFAGCMLVGCTHAPETVVHLSAPSGGAWSVRNHEGARLCSLPCRVELETNQAVVVGRDHSTGSTSEMGGAQEFVVHQESLGAGFWSGSVRVRREPSAGAIAMHAVSSSLLLAGNTLVDSRREDRVTAGIVLSGLGTVGMLASSAWPGKPREELWLERMATP
jgi:hypothetical protein